MVECRDALFIYEGIFLKCKTSIKETALIAHDYQNLPISECKSYVSLQLAQTQVRITKAKTTFGLVFVVADRDYFLRFDAAGPAAAHASLAA